ncbi:hypothetical protein ACWU4D_19545 [Vibrio sp. WJH972]
MNANRQQRTGYIWNNDVYINREYISPDGNIYCLKHLDNKTHNYKYKYRDDDGNRNSGSIDIEVRYDPHCFTRSRREGETTPALSFDTFNDGSTLDRVFDIERYNNSQYLIQAIQHLSNKSCKESRRQKSKVLFFKQKNRQRANYGMYVIIKLKKDNGKLIMFVETAHNRTNEPPKLDLSDKEETYSIILGRLIKEEWPELIEQK